MPTPRGACHDHLDRYPKRREGICPRRAGGSGGRVPADPRWAARRADWPVGSGKTTLLRMLAGLEFPDRGSIHFDGVDVTDRPARLRGVGFVFQHYALFRHLSVFENIAFPLRVRHWPRAEVTARVEELLALVQLEEMGSRRVTQLSGGQAQRVALARALAPHPAVLLLDEPFGALDTEVRHELRQWLRKLHDEVQVTSVLVTHDQEEALEIADLVAVLRAGHWSGLRRPPSCWRSRRHHLWNSSYAERPLPEARPSRRSGRSRCAMPSNGGSVAISDVNHGTTVGAGAAFRPPVANARSDTSLDRVREALRALRFGVVTITVHDGVVVQVDRTERIRLDR